MTSRITILATLAAAFCAAAVAPADAGPRGQTVQFKNPGVTLTVRPTVPGHFGRHDSWLLDQDGGGALPAATGFAATVLPQGAAMLLPAIQAAREPR